MFVDFYFDLRENGLPVSPHEFITFLTCLKNGRSNYNVNNFYFLAKTSLVKHEKYLDLFDQIFGKNFSGLETLDLSEIVSKINLPEEWLKKMVEKYLSKKEMDDLEAIGSLEKLLETLKQRVKEQKKRHQGGNKWIGTAGTSPFGAYGFNPEGIRIGQNESRHQKAVKVWDKRLFRNLDENREIGSRSMKVALKRLRKWARTGTEDELDMDATIFSTARNGFLNIKTRPERQNAVKIIIFFDIGGSMDMHVAAVEELFSATRSAFKHLEYYYFHNCLYDYVWKNNNRRWTEKIPTVDILNKYNKDYKCIFVGDASMSPYEIEAVGGGNEHYNAETGRVWLERTKTHWPNHLWINPSPKEYWLYTQSIEIIKSIFKDKMVPLTLNGLEDGMRMLG